jgi:hypothetical protein
LVKQYAFYMKRALVRPRSRLRRRSRARDLDLNLDRSSFGRRATPRLARSTVA